MIQPIFRLKKKHWRSHGTLHSSCVQCFLFSRNIGEVTSKIIYFYYLKIYFPDRSIQKNISFNFEKGSTACVLYSSTACQPSSRHICLSVISFSKLIQLLFGICLIELILFPKHEHVCSLPMIRSEPPSVFQLSGNKPQTRTTNTKIKRRIELTSIRTAVAI